MTITSHLLIAASYWAIPLLVLPYLHLTKPVNRLGVLFLLSGGATHVAATVDFGSHACSMWWTLLRAGHAVMMVAFVIAFWRLLRAASRLRRGEGTSGSNP
ncbi:hypothetical protein ABZ671_00920 [Micromonospora sp. NPDC006766]|uniref:hypothetical protein n=1 Tax=Micromonospora sp. NPDC006766 TaxID=3154778 RepID=UPI003403CAA7